LTRGSAGAAAPAVRVNAVRLVSGAGRWLLVASVVMAQAGGVWAADEIACPQTIAAESRLSAPPASWEVRYGDAKCDLMGVTFYEGRPSEGASLVYDRASKSGKTWTATWRLTANGGRGYWIGCTYTNTNAILYKKLRDGLAECRVTYDRSVSTAGLPTVKAIRCQ
jgi:hypothetical protein